MRGLLEDTGQIQKTMIHGLHSREMQGTSLNLTEPTAEYAQQISEYRKDFLESGDSMDGIDDLRTIANPIAWIHPKS